MDGVSVRPMREDEAEAVRAMRLRALQSAPDAFGSRYEDELAVSPDQYERRTRRTIESNDLEILVAETSGELVGMCFVHLLAEDHTCGDVGGMWVEEQYHGRGVGRALLAESEAWSLARGAVAIILWVTEGNSTAQGLYESAGYRPTGRDNVHPVRNWLTVFQMQKQLTVAPGDS